MKQILVVDDDHAIRRTLELHLTGENHGVVTAADGQAGLDQALAGSFDLVLLDLRLPKLDGFAVLQRIKEARPSLPVVVITAFDDMQTAIEAIRLGAADHLGKPLDLDQLDAVVARLFEVSALAAGGIRLGEAPAEAFEPNVMIGRSRAMKEVYKAIGAVADSRTTVLLHGESGTGKELVARALHFNSRFRARPFVAVACSALAPSVLESELFGHERGAFTGAFQTKPGRFELAQGGSLFLDEISEVSPDIQVKLLRFLQERVFERVGGVESIQADVRVIAATNRDLTALVGDGRFRRDLYYRLQVVVIELPPLRERRDDLPLLVQFFLGKLCRELDKAVEVVPQAVMRRLLEHPWPGNVRELENVLRRAVLLSPGPVLDPDTLQLDSSVEGHRVPLQLKTLGELEREHIENILAFTGYEKKRAAQLLGISRPTLDKRIREYGLRLPER